jgi:hypothetical protein
MQDEEQAAVRAANTLFDRHMTPLRHVFKTYSSYEEKLKRYSSPPHPIFFCVNPKKKLLFCVNPEKNTHTHTCNHTLTSPPIRFFCLGASSRVCVCVCVCVRARARAVMSQRLIGSQVAKVCFVCWLQFCVCVCVRARALTYKLCTHSEEPHSLSLSLSLSLSRSLALALSRSLSRSRSLTRTH